MIKRLLTVIYLDDGSSPRLTAMLSACLKTAEESLGMDAEVLSWDRIADGEVTSLDSRLLLMAVPLGHEGINDRYYQFLARIRREPSWFRGSLAGLVIDGSDELYTKSTATELVFSANRAGCRFIGRPLVEATGELNNFHVLAQVAACSREEAYRRALLDLIDRLVNHAAMTESGWVIRPHSLKDAFPRPDEEGSIRRQREAALGRHAPAASSGSSSGELSDKASGKPVILALHASNRRVSNTLDLWQLTSRHLKKDCEVIEIGLRNGKIEDCAGCSFRTCLHFGEKGKCVYGGVIVDEVYPALLKASALVFLCANYNDALQANVSACINRLTALFRRNFFWDKKIFGIVVSGYSGGDLIARQLIGSLTMNKSFQLPPDFSLLVTANDRGSLVKLPGIEEQAARFARRILSEVTGELPCTTE